MLSNANGRGAPLGVFTIAVALATLAGISTRGADQRGTIRGVVKQASGEPAEGALVKARYTTGLMITVVSQAGGVYTIPDLPAGTYNVQATGGGFQSAAAPIQVAAGAEANAGLVLSAPQSFLDMRSITKLADLMPEDAGKGTIVGLCTDCHHYGLNEVISQRKTREGWAETIKRMRANPGATGRTEGGDGGRSLQIWDHELKLALDYLSKHYGPDALPLDPKTVPPPSDSWVKGPAAKAVVVEYRITPGSSPHDVAVDSKGIGWVTEGRHGYIGRFDPTTYGYTRIQVPGGPSSPTAVEVDPQDRVWVSDGRQNRLVRYDPRTESFESFVIRPIAEGRINANTIRFLADGTVWFTGINDNKIVRLDPATKAVKIIPVPAGVAAGENVNPYGMAVDKNGKIWVALRRADKVAKIDPATAELVEFDIPTKGAVLRRMNTDNTGNPWFGQYGGVGKLAMIDHRTSKITEYPTPTKYSGAYSVDIDRQHDIIWFNEMMADKIARFDPRAKTFVEYTIPTPYSSIRRIEVDKSRPTRVWFSGSHVDTVGYLDVSD
jgi:virginiamycin B lyase